MTPIAPYSLTASKSIRLGAGAALLCGAWALTACSSKPVDPDWQMNAQSAAHKAQQAYLSGNARVEKLEWDKARAEVSRTGRADLMARLELMRCAVQVASLVAEPCVRFETLRADAAAPERAYADYLAGTLDAKDVPLLPSAQRGAAAASDSVALTSIADPLSRLVAAGVLFKTGKANPDTIEKATEAASAQGWRRPLLAWLTLQSQRAQAAGDQPALEALRRRIALTENAPVP